ncbi:MAG: peroxiredoxin [Alphaproteobacteria bacterium]|nr:peroxiredoxin [Alphaproteobacteria bacterium]
MLGVGQKFPDFNLKAVVSSDIKTAFTTVDSASLKGKWFVVFFWPKDFTFVCPTEIAEFGMLYKDFKDRKAEVLGASIDTEFVHLAWRQQKNELNQLPFPMLADVKRELSTALGIIDQHEGVSQRATYIVDPEGIVRFVMVTDLNVGRNVAEVLRVLDALQTGGLTPCMWQPGQNTIQVS